MIEHTAVQRQFPSGMACLRCDVGLPIADDDGGCPACAAEGHAANLRLVFSDAAPGRIVLPSADAVSLGEGGTPQVEAPDLAADAGLGRLSLKLEWCNPTGSHKDRMSAPLMARARERSAPLVVGASSGNAGLSLAAYAARAGLPSEIVTTPSMPAGARRAIRTHGARLVEVPDGAARWRHVGRRVAEGAFAATNYRMPAIGTNPFGIAGYKVLAVEIAAHGLPDLVVVPCARGDLLSGLLLGFLELGRGVPCLVAAEPFPRLARVLAGADYRESFPGRTAQLSIGGDTVTFQALHALRESRGRAVVADDAAARAAQARLGRAGFHAELSAAAAFAALVALGADGALAGRHAVAVLTGSGAGAMDRDETAATAQTPPFDHRGTR
ncbi:pyridoxal-phosphate dependent enzyme [Methylobacterium terricola]|uniref:Pyridoxal-phosphate dependent enzyme n=1 Tax=Methylobacterium terricola TaxID=2583531 RepID=A0A5C4LC09_9HYPH|nr:pyridoxal-phosphate dependent enzyme [Methylobacterium terricola]TNC10059.1 pyridoxal-phosphate dependent enzyme [Methylobacterium terricola]